MCLTLEGTIRDGGEVVCCEIEGQKLQQSFECPACDVVQQIVRQVELENHRQATKRASLQFRQPVVLQVVTGLPSVLGRDVMSTDFRSPLLFHPLRLSLRNVDKHLSIYTVSQPGGFNIY